jgi:hypothetical protein
MMRKGRHAPFSKKTHGAGHLLAIEKNRKSHCARGHEFTAQNTGRHRKGSRYCKQCHKAASDKYYRTHTRLAVTAQNAGAAE